MTRVCALVGIIGIMLVGCARVADDRPRIRVELDVFSGRSNPSWELAAEQTSELGTLLRDLPQTDIPFPQNGLGYRGFLLMRVGSGIDLPESIRVYRGVVETYDGIRSIRSKDLGNRLERWLLNTARPHIDGNLYDSIREEIDGRTETDGDERNNFPAQFSVHNL